MKNEIVTNVQDADIDVIIKSFNKNINNYKIEVITEMASIVCDERILE